MGEGGVNNSENFLTCLWLVPKGGKVVTNPYRTMSFCLGCLSCSASSSSLFMTLVASELPEVPSDLSPVLLEFDKRRGSWWPENRTEEKILHIRKSRVSHNMESFVEINVTVHRYNPIYLNIRDHSCILHMGEGSPKIIKMCLHNIWMAPNLYLSEKIIIKKWNRL